MNKKDNQCITFLNWNIIDEIFNIDYSVKIHNLSICKCKRIQYAKENIKIDSSDEIVYVIEKMWNDEKIECRPKIYLS